MRFSVVFCLFPRSSKASASLELVAEIYLHTCAFVFVSVAIVFRSDVAAISELANAATSNRITIATLPNTNAQLCKEIAATNSKLAEALERLGNKQNLTENSTRHYCWSCGSQSNHPSGECTKKKDMSPLQLFKTKKLDRKNRCFRTGDIVAVCV